MHYDPGKTESAVIQVLAEKKRALVIPVLVAHDPQFQIDIIGGGIARVPDHQNRVVYKPDSILPDPDLEQWVLEVTGKLARR